jgi:hypothetical protein
MNFSCSKFRAAAAHLTDHSIAIDIDNMEKTIVDMTALVESVSQAMKSTSSQSPCADLLNAKPGRPPDRQIFIRFLNPIAALADRKSPGAISD